MATQALLHADFGLPEGARRPLALVGALFCAASFLPLFSQTDLKVAWSRAPHVAVRLVPLPAEPPAFANRARSNTGPREVHVPRAAVVRPIAPRPAVAPRRKAVPSVARPLPDDVGPPGTFAMYVLAVPPARSHAATVDPVAPVAAVVPTPAAGPVPAAAPRRERLAYLEIASASTHNYNEFSSGQWRPESLMVEGAYALAHPGLALKLDYSGDVYVTNDSFVASSGVHQTRFTTVTGADAQTPVFYARQSTFDVRLEAQVLRPHIYAGVGYIHATNNYHFAHLDGVGVGLEKLPDFHGPLSVYGSLFYYPAVNGTSSVTNPSSPNAGGASFQQSYAITKFDVGAMVKPAHVPVYIYGGFSGDLYHAKEAAPVNQSHSGAYAGLGVKL